jgi:hypothetical protein
MKWRSGAHIVAHMAQPYPGISASRAGCRFTITAGIKDTRSGSIPVILLSDAKMGDKNGRSEAGTRIAPRP